MSAMLASGKHFDGVWTSGIDYTVIEAIKAANKPFVPFVALTTMASAKFDRLQKDGLVGVAVANSPAIGAAWSSPPMSCKEASDSNHRSDGLV